ncbi:MAG: FdtA/QdtA family cupin domain-containing protein [Saprospiraceae bacterium]|nr:FdtA/QdtA family cupin domain-containing protein [Candidatus Opimibacter iunctus]
MKEAHIITFPSKGHRDEGFLHIIEQGYLPFTMRRIFYTMDTPAEVTRGGHAHHETEMVLIAVQGTISVRTITIDGLSSTFTLQHPAEGLYLPKLCWHEMNYSKDAVQMVICNTAYHEQDYIRDWAQFKSLLPSHG